MDMVGHVDSLTQTNQRIAFGLRLCSFAPGSFEPPVPCAVYSTMVKISRWPDFTSGVIF